MCLSHRRAYSVMGGLVPGQVGQRGRIKQRDSRNQTSLILALSPYLCRPQCPFYDIGVVTAPTSHVFSAVVGMKRVSCVKYLNI